MANTGLVFRKNAFVPKEAPQRGICSQLAAKVITDAHGHDQVRLAPADKLKRDRRIDVARLEEVPVPTRRAILARVEIDELSCVSVFSAERRNLRWKKK